MWRHFWSVWYATPERVASTTKRFVYDDDGPLEITPDGISYRTRKMDLSIRDVVSVSLTRQQIPRTAYLVVNAVALLYILNILRTSRDLKRFGYLLAMLAVLNLLGLLVARGTKWVLIEYLDESGTVRRAYLANGAGQGWAGLFGGTTRLYRAIAAYKEFADSRKNQANGAGSPRISGCSAGDPSPHSSRSGVEPQSITAPQPPDEADHRYGGHN